MKMILRSSASDLSRSLMLLAGGVLALSASSCLSTTETPELKTQDSIKKHQGVFAIVRSKEIDTLEANIEQMKHIDGITIYTGLSKIRPAKDQYDWTPIDRIFELCAKYDKKINLAIPAGRWSPEWIYAEGAEKFSWRMKEDYVDPGEANWTAPVPWDPVYLKILKETAEKAAERYKDSPLLVSVQVTGPSLANGLEANLNISRKQAESIKYSPEKFINAWKYMFDAYANAFPKQRLSWCIHDMMPDGRNPVPGRTIRDWAIEKYGKRLDLMVCYLTYEDWFKSGNQAVDIWTEKYPDIQRGAQMVDIYSKKKLPKQQYEKAVRNGLTHGASFIEIFLDDAIYPDYKDISLERSGK